MDNRNKIEKFLDSYIGLPLYYCSACLRPVVVKADSEGTKILRKCECSSDVLIYAPRRVFLTGVGGKVTMKNKLIEWLHKIGSVITRRTIGVHHPKVVDMSAGISGSAQVGL